MSVPASETPANQPARPARWWIALAPFVAAGLIWGGWAWWRDRSYREAITRIELEMANGRFGIAARDLRRLLLQEPGSDEAAVLLGRCEKERGRPKAAAEALARVAPGSPFAHKAILARMRLAHDRGELAVAEQIIDDAAGDPRNDRTHIRFLLVPIYSQLGRIDEAKRLIEERWQHLQQTAEGASEPAIDLVRQHIELDFKPNPVENVRTYLDQAFQMARDDDRVWLGRANLALRIGDHAEAKRWLDDCLRRNHQDVPVWSSWLRLGIATGRIGMVQEALQRLPADEVKPDQLHRLKAWLAAQRGDVESEKSELERLLAADPADLAALDRLAPLAEKNGQPARAAELRDKQAEVQRLRARYEKLYDRNQPIRDAEEMAEIAEKLGRTFEARIFLTLATSEDPERADLRQKLRRLSQNSATTAEGGKTLAELVGFANSGQKLAQ
jgi:tetratricopeptide (TPR) repeat protein